MADIIWIKTHRYSEFFKCLFVEYNENVEIEIDGRLHTEKDIPHLLKEWCTNHVIRGTRDFSLKRDGLILFSFHDTPDDFWAAMSERPFIEKAASEKIIRYRIGKFDNKPDYVGYVFILIVILILIVIVRFLARRVFHA